VTVLTGVWHYSFHVSDLDVSVGFYAGLLGMELVHRQEQDNAYTRRLVGYPDARLLVAQLRLPGAAGATATGTVSSHTLELVEYVVPRPARVPLERALPGTGHLAFAVARVPAIGAVAGPLRETLGRLLGAVRPRPGYSLVHGELGPEHVIVAGGEPVLIDVEGLMFADAEWEHAYLRMRLGDRYALLDPGDLDPARLELYALALHLSLVAGPLRLAGGPVTWGP